MKSAIYTVNATATSVAVDGVIPLGSTIRRFGSNIVQNGNDIALSGAGYYDVSASITLAPTAVGDVTVTMYADGVAVPGATATETVYTANKYANLSIKALFRQVCCQSVTNITFVLTGAAASVTNTSVVIEKV